jgi:hypothetical protein
VSDGMAWRGRDAGPVTRAPFVLGEEPGAFVAGFDVHRRQITIDALDTATGDVSRGQIESTPAAVPGVGRQIPLPGRSCRGGAVHGLAVRMPGARALGRCRAPGRAG